MTQQPSKATIRRKWAALCIAATLASCGGDKPVNLIASAKDYIAKNEHKTAIIQLKTALQKEPESAEVRFLLGKSMLAVGDASADVELRKARELKYPADKVAVELFRYYVLSGQNKRVIDESGAVIGSSPEITADLLSSVAAAHAQLGNRAGAEKAVAGALEAKPDYAPALLVKAQLAGTKGDFDAALAITNAIVARDSTYAEGWKLKGDLLAARNEIEPAIAAYRKAIEARANHFFAHYSLTTLLHSLGKLDEADKQTNAMQAALPGHPMILLLRAQTAYLKLDYAKARDISQQFLKLKPDDFNGLLQAAAISFQLKSYDQTILSLKKALRIVPGSIFGRRLLARTYLDTGRPRNALETLTPVLANIGNDAQALALVGEVFLGNGDQAKAEAYFERSAKLDPKNPETRMALAMARFNQRSGDSTVQELESIAAADAGTIADVALIATQMRLAQSDNALRSLERLEKKRPKDPYVHLLRGRLLQSRGDMSGARKSFELAVARNADYFQAIANLADLDLRENKPLDAHKRFETMLAKDEKNVAALQALAELKQRAGAPVSEVVALLNKAIAASPDEIALRLALIGSHMRAQETNKALAAAQDAMAALPNEPGVYEAVGAIFVEIGEHNQALSTYQKWAALEPSSPRPHIRLAEVNVANKNPRSAVLNLRKALDVDPDNVEALLKLAVLEAQAGKSADALKIARAVQKRVPDEPAGFSVEGDLLVGNQSWAEAVSAYRAALKLERRSDVAIKLHSALSKTNGAEAGRFSGEWLKEQPRDAKFRGYLGESALLRKDYPNAVTNFLAALEIRPDDVRVLNNLAWVSGQLKDPKAVDFAEKANRLAPNQPVLMDTLASLLAERGDTERALELFKKAVELAPPAAEVRLNYARLLVKAGRKPEARRQLEELTKLGDKFSGSAEVARLSREL